MSKNSVNKRPKNLAAAPIVWLALVAWITFMLISAFAPIDETALQTYNLEETTLRLLGVAVGIPVLAIWLLIAFAASRVQNYARLLGESLDGKGFGFIGWGIGLFLLGSVVGSLIGTLLPYARDSVGQYQALVITRNIAEVFLQVAAYGFLLAGSWQLRKLVKKPMPWLVLVGGVLLLAVFMVYVVNLLLGNPDRNLVSVDAVGSYFMSDVLIWILVLLPIALGWVLGLAALVNMAVFVRYVKGVIYRIALKRFAIGFGIVLALSVAVQIIVQYLQLGDSVSLGAILVLIMLIFAIWLTGFWYVARGARELAKIEAVELPVTEGGK